MKSTEEKKRELLNAPVGRMVFYLALPAVASMLVTALYNMADTYFVGRIDTVATGAVSVSFGLMSVIQACGFFFGHGSGNFISLRLGRGETDRARKMAVFGVVISFAAGLVISALGLVFCRPLALLLGSTDTILPTAVGYMRIILIGAPFMCASFTMNNLLRFQGNTVYGMVGIVAGALLNIALDPLFIFVFKMDVEGAALATLISQLVGFVVLAFGCNRKGALGLDLKLFGVTKEFVKELFRGGSPSLFRQGFMAISVIMLNRACRVAPAGEVDAAIAAMGVVSKIMGFAFSVIIGVGQGFQPVCGFNYGAGKFDRVKKAFWLCVGASTALLAVFSAVGAIFSGPLVAFFRDDPAVVRIGSAALRFQCAAFVLSGFTTMSNMMLQNIGKVFRASFLAVARQGLFFIPVILVFSNLFGLTGVEITQPVCDVLAFISALILHLPVLASLKREKSGE
ncbi:MAG: MATE family efflux transporter [Clostridia bacterium]|nr:MATE family efflux transporter [Clostridia bacterium]